MRLLPTPDPQRLYPHQPSSRVLAAGWNVVVGVRLLLPDRILSDPRNPAYRVALTHFVGDVPLGLVALILGAVMLAGLYTSRGRSIVLAATGLALLTWLLFAVDIALAFLPQLGTIVYAQVAVLHAFAYWHTVAYNRQQDRL